MARDTALTASIAEEAAHWWIVFHGDDVSPADHREFAEWVARSPERVEAYLRAGQLEHTLKKADIQWPATPTEVLVREAKASPRDEFEIRRERTVFVPEQSHGWLTQPRLAFGCVAACLVVAGSVWFVLTRPLELQTKLGEQRSVVLADGSRVTLNTATKVEIVLQKQIRIVRLLRGEALFEVTHDASRPFEVVTDSATLRDLGTQFDVDERPDRTAITVIDGRVAVVSSAGLTGASTTLLSAADRLVIGATGISELEHDVNTRAATAWTQHRLIFERRPLGEVAAEFNRYNRDQIQIESADLRDQAITGVFQSNEAGSFVSFLAAIPGVQVSDDSNGNHVVTLAGRTSPGK
jgi:transmembrane sensor